MTVRSKIVRQDMEEGGTWEGKRSGGWEKGIRRGETGKYLLIQTACDRVSCLIMHVFYDWHCMTMCTCIILIVNLQSE